MPRRAARCSGLTRDTGPAEIAAATLNSVCYQTRDLIEAMRGDGAQIDELRVDGGMVVNDPLMQRLADTVGAPVERPRVIETTALGAAFLAGLQAGLWPSLEALSATWSLDRAFRPSEAAPSRDRRYAGWKARRPARAQQACLPRSRARELIFAALN